MKKLRHDYLRDTQPSEAEFLFTIIFITISATIAFSVLDIIIHDNFILQIISNCYEGNTSDFCVEIRELNNCPPNSQMCIGQKYWVLLPQLVLMLGVALAIIRIFLGGLAGAEINPMLFLIGVLWFFSVVALLYFGWGDFLYYALRGIEIPETLEWLNGVGFFKYFSFFGQPDVVEKGDLYFTMFVGFLLLVGSWIAMTHHYRKGTLHKLGLAS